ncbi:glycosyl hydrolase [Actinomadura sp. DC4]|uniref:glycosyl hydrolase n=1 Tax=Actinomadura sp. DC4 TaxID=3055069 RepID=UPI0025B13599|nr:glycosyl hydrolase [Actinomadura sp. DC4]MDN3352513.1 glycosyl hydrolase [Actinomadura sp. DC4]
MDRRMPWRAFLALATATSLVACGGGPGGDDLPGLSDRSGGASATPDKCTVSAKLVPSCGAWWGVTPAVGARQDPSSIVHAYERQIGRPVDIYHGYHSTNDLFPTASEIALTRESGRHRMLVLNWKPDSGKTWRQVAAGAADAQIDREAAYLKSHFTKKFWLVIHHEPEEEVKTGLNSGYTAEDYRKMFRHVVTEFRSQGARNILFTMVYMGYSGYMVKPWFKDLYPGDSYVDWVGFDPFAKSNIKDFPGLLNKVAAPQQSLGFPGFYDYSNKYFPDKPLMLSEWAVLETPGDPGRKPAFFRNVAKEFANFPRVKALAYYNTTHAVNMPDGGNTSIDATPSALKAFRTLGKSPEFNVRR